MSSFGENLRREREMRGIPLEEISAATKISVRFLNDLENNDFADIPGGIFTRGFIRAYAGYLGLDLEQVMSEYEAEAQPQDYELDRLVSANRRRQQRRPIRVVPLAVAAILLASGYALFRYAHRAADAPAPPPPAAPDQPPAAAVRQPSGPQPSSVTPSTALPASNVAASLPSSTAPNPAAGSSPGEANPAAAPNASAAPAAAQPGAIGRADDLVLQVAATERVWVSVETDGKDSWQRTLDPNDVTTLKAKDYFDLTTGNAQGLVLTLNGETLKPLGREGEVKKIHLTRDDLKSPNP